MIGLLQTCVAPEDIVEWEERYVEPMSSRYLQEAFGAWKDAFALDAEVGSPAFLQDLTLEDGEEKGIAGLLIDAPGGKTLKDNLDFFIKGGLVNALCPSCTALALFTLQTNAPSGGVGHRVGLRGGGPLTTLLRPVGDSSLWQKLWLNVLDQEQGLKTSAESMDASILPWLALTRLSDKSGKATLPDDTHPLQMYWGMPRRIRLCPASQSGECDLCGEQDLPLYSRYRTRNYGVNYEGPWLHPLTPYRFDLKKENEPLSLKGQKGGLGYRHWLGFMFHDDGNGDRASIIVQDFFNNKSRELDSEKQLSLWCFGYDMDNMKARCWYEHILPVFHLEPEQIVNVQAWIQTLLTSAKDSAPLLRKYVKEGWYRRPEDATGDVGFIDTEFWQATENDFYRLLGQMAALPVGADRVPPEIYGDWRSVLYKSVLELFDHFTLQTSVEELDLKRIVNARDALVKKFNSMKSIKHLREKGQVAKEVANG
ncbi:type I-E CRISPR-associated protein Cse1/CasA [Spongiibacter taiwanensis]